MIEQICKIIKYYLNVFLCGLLGFRIICSNVLSYESCVIYNGLPSAFCVHFPTWYCYDDLLESHGMILLWWPARIPHQHDIAMKTCLNPPLRYCYDDLIESPDMIFLWWPARIPRHDIVVMTCSNPPTWYCCDDLLESPNILCCWPARNPPPIWYSCVDLLESPSPNMILMFWPARNPPTWYCCVDLGWPAWVA